MGLTESVNNGTKSDKFLICDRPGEIRWAVFAFGRPSKPRATPLTIAPHYVRMLQHALPPETLLT